MAVTELERKVTKIGNSLGITIPADFLKKIEISLGDHVNIEVRNEEIVITKSKKVELPKGISTDFFEVLNETIANYDTTLRRLMDR